MLGLFPQPAGIAHAPEVANNNRRQQELEYAHRDNLALVAFCYFVLESRGNGAETGEEGYDVDADQAVGHALGDVRVELLVRAAAVEHFVAALEEVAAAITVAHFLMKSKF